MSSMPVLFIGHGSPLTAFEDNQFTRSWAAMVNGIQPTAVLCVSAHWCTNGTGVTAMTSPRTIHDFHGFPDDLYQFHYSAPGSPELAHRVKQLLPSLDVVLDQHWGFDHGCWAVMKHVFPQADVPVVQLSIDMQRDAQWHYDLGKQLSVLRNEGTLIIGSGNIVHNLRQLDFSDSGQIFPWAQRFNDHVRQSIESHNHHAIIQYQQGDDELRRAAMLSVPTPDHYYPLLYVLGASTPNDPIDISLDEIVLGSIAMMSVKLG